MQEQLGSSVYCCVGCRAAMHLSTYSFLLCKYGCPLYAVALNLLVSWLCHTQRTSVITWGRFAWDILLFVCLCLVMTVLQCHTMHVGEQSNFAGTQGLHDTANLLRRDQYTRTCLVMCCVWDWLMHCPMSWLRKNTAARSRHFLSNIHGYVVTGARGACLCQPCLSAHSSSWLARYPRFQSRAIQSDLWIRSILSSGAHQMCRMASQTTL